MSSSSSLSALSSGQEPSIEKAKNSRNDEVGLKNKALFSSTSTLESVNSHGHQKENIN